MTRTRTRVVKTSPVCCSSIDCCACRAAPSYRLLPSDTLVIGQLTVLGCISLFMFALLLLFCFTMIFLGDTVRVLCWRSDHNTVCRPVVLCCIYMSKTASNLCPDLDFKCPMCNKTVPSDDIECHVVICLTRPKIIYNGTYILFCLYMYICRKTTFVSHPSRVMYILPMIYDCFPVAQIPGLSVTFPWCYIMHASHLHCACVCM